MKQKKTDEDIYQYHFDNSVIECLENTLGIDSIATKFIGEMGNFVGGRIFIRSADNHLGISKTDRISNLSGIRERSSNLIERIGRLANSFPGLDSEMMVEAGRRDFHTGTALAHGIYKVTKSNEKKHDAVFEPYVAKLGELIEACGLAIAAVNEEPRNKADHLELNYIDRAAVGLYAALYGCFPSSNSNGAFCNAMSMIYPLVVTSVVTDNAGQRIRKEIKRRKLELGSADAIAGYKTKPRLHPKQPSARY